jgi:hypothetical protein
MKIIYVSVAKLTDKIERDWYINFCRECGESVEFWDLSPFMRVDYLDSNQIQTSYLVSINSISEFEKLLKLPSNKSAIYVMLMSYSAKFSGPYRLLSKNNCKTVFMNWGYMPTSKIPMPGWGSRFTRLLASPKRFLFQLPDILLGKLYRKIGLVKKYDIVFVAGDALFSFQQYSKKTIRFNLCDYDNFQIEAFNSKKAIHEKKYAVFLDANLPYQSDLSICGLPAVNPEKYFRSLNNFFDSFEKNHNLSIVIALHPKSEYGSEKFNGRKTIKMQTPNLVKYSEIVVTHTSTAISYAVLNMKPILLIYTAEMQEIYGDSVMLEIEGLSSYLGCKTCNIDVLSKNKALINPSINIKSYIDYKYNFLTSPATENFLSSEIFLQGLKNLYLYG